MKNNILLLLIMPFLMKSTEIEISISEQKLFLLDNKSVIKTYLISSSKYGEGSKVNSFKTPLGKHVVKRKIGKDMPLGARFIGRSFSGEIYPIYDSDQVLVEDDVVQSRILWLDGLEDGINKGEGVDSYSRYIYIHGTPEEWLLGEKASKGCIRMSNKDVIELFNLVEEGIQVTINK
ncbi:L,D-transpeptidase [bacterium]|nr:L,D-transpeptidase [bacterium]